MVEHWTVTPGVAGSSPVSHPNPSLELSLAAREGPGGLGLAAAGAGGCDRLSEESLRSIAHIAA